VYFRRPIPDDSNVDWFSGRLSEPPFSDHISPETLVLEYHVHHCRTGRTENADGEGTKSQWQQQWIAPSLQASDMQGEEDGKQPEDASESDNSGFREEKNPRRDHKPAGPCECSCRATTPPGITHPHAVILSALSRVVPVLDPGFWVVERQDQLRDAGRMREKFNSGWTRRSLERLVRRSSTAESSSGNHLGCRQSDSR
jgi:hypothetical protein